MKNIFTLLFFLISLKGFSQQPIFATISGGDLYSFDLTNCTRHFIGSTGQGFGDIAFTTDGRLWGIISGQLYQIDTATANSTLVGATGVQSNNLVALNDSILLTEAGLKLYGINANNLSSYYIDTIGYGASGDLTWYDDDLYMITPLIKIVLNSSNSAIVSVTPISLTVPTCEGAITASFSGDYNSIVGFNGPNLIKVCQIDGSHQSLCPALNLGGTAGGASIRLATQVPQPTICHMPTSVDYLTSVNSKINLSQNPFSTQLTFTLAANEPTTVSLYDFLGQQILQQTFTNATTINTEQLQAGIYFYELSNAKGTLKTGKLVKQ